MGSRRYRLSYEGILWGPEVGMAAPRGARGVQHSNRSPFSCVGRGRTRAANSTPRFQKGTLLSTQNAWWLSPTLVQNVCFSMAGELPGGPGREGWEPSGALSGAVGSVREARRGVRASRGELLRAFGRSFWGSGDNFRTLARFLFCFFNEIDNQSHDAHRFRTSRGS